MPGPNVWVWDENLRRYRDSETGRFLSFAAVTEQVNRIVDTTTERVTDVLVDMLTDNRLSVADWERAMARAIKDAYVQNAILAAGGREQMTPAMWGSIGGRLRGQYRYLRNFTDQIANGELTVGQIGARADMYINSSRQAFWAVRTRKERNNGMTEEKWHSIGDASTCSPCMEADLMGFQPLGTFAEPGSGRVLMDPETYCEGIVRCRCEKSFRRGPQ